MVCQAGQLPLVINFDQHRPAAVSIPQLPLEGKRLSTGIEAIAKPFSISADDGVIGSPQLTSRGSILILANEPVSCSSFAVDLDEHSFLVRAAI